MCNGGTACIAPSGRRVGVRVPSHPGVRLRGRRVRCFDRGVESGRELLAPKCVSEAEPVWRLALGRPGRGRRDVPPGYFKITGELSIYSLNFRAGARRLGREA